MTKKLSKKDALDLVNKVIKGAEPPIALLNAMYKEAPDSIRAFIDHHMMVILRVDMPRLAFVNAKGPTVDMKSDEYHTVEEAFAQSMKLAETAVPDLFKQLTATIRHGGIEIAAVIDTTIRRCVLQDFVINREAYMDVLSCHARLISALKGITEVPPGANNADSDTATK